MALDAGGALVLVGHTSRGDGTFILDTMFSGNTNAKPFAADFNADGYGDIGVWETETGKWFIQYGNGLGQFSHQTIYFWNADDNAQPFVGDFDGDGYGDIGVWEANTGRWYVHFGNGTGQFGSQNVFYWAASVNEDASAFSGKFNTVWLADIGIWDRATGWWKIQYNSTPFAFLRRFAKSSTDRH